jgi:hypothetical protein
MFADFCPHLKRSLERIVSFIARTQHVCRFLPTLETIAGPDRFIDASFLGFWR